MTLFKASNTDAIPITNKVSTSTPIPVLSLLTRYIQRQQQITCRATMSRSRLVLTGLIACAGLTLGGCGGDDDDDISTVVQPTVISDATLIDAPVVTQEFSAAELKAAVEAAGLSDIVARDPVCGITVQYMNHTTTGLKGEATNATGAVIVPSGDDSHCQGERPITLYAHGTTPAKSYNLAALNDPTNPAYNKALVVAASYAGQGDILIAPNYPGYDKSTLPYAPYITAQQGRQMVDGLHAGKLVLEQLNDKNKSVSAAVKASDKLFVTGYSQGGYVAMATAKALDEVGLTPTAVSPGSGPYAVNAFGDSVMLGNIIFGGTLFLPMITSSYEAEYGDLLSGVYTDKYKDDAASLFPTDESLFSIFLNGKLPTTQLFEQRPTGYELLDDISPANPDYAFGFSSSNYLFNTDFRAKYIEDMTQYPDGIVPTFKGPAAKAPDKSDLAVRQAFIDNDLRAYVPTAPILLCGGNQDPSVTFDINTYAQAQIWKQNTNVKFAMLDVDASNQDSRTTEGKPAYISNLPTVIDNEIRTAAASLQAGFGEQLEAMLSAAEQSAYDKAIEAGKSEAEAQALGEAARKTRLLQSYDYHTSVDPYCLSAANTFFDQYR